MLNNAKWIAYPGDTRYDCPVFHRDFAATKDVKKATITVTAMGCYYA